MDQKLPVGVRQIEFQMHHDERGWVAELFRAEWDTGMDLVQWNTVFSHPETMRGFHVHVTHADYLIALRGEMLLGLKDLRRASSTFGLSVMITLSGEDLAGWIIPPGVGHGFYFPTESIHCYAMSEYWNPDEELGCRWDDPDLGLAWPVTNPLLSENDWNAPGLKGIMTILHQYEL